MTLLERNNDFLGEECYSAKVFGTPLILTEPFDSFKKVKKIVDISRVGHTIPQRIVCHQVSATEPEWDSIQNQNQFLAFFNEDLNVSEALIHFSQPLDFILTKRPPSKEVNAVIDAWKKLPKLLNGEGWLDVCSLYNEQLERGLAHIHYDATEAYSLERYIKDFQHETNSEFLRRTRRHHFVLQKTLGTNETLGEKSYKEILGIEKKIISVRDEMLRLLREHYAVLKEVVHLIPFAEALHPELAGIKRTGQILKEMLGSELDMPDVPSLKWGTSQMLSQLLNQDFGFFTTIQGSFKRGDIFLAFSLRAALLQMQSDCSFQDLLNMCINWEFDSKRVNRRVFSEEADRIPLKKSERQVIAFRERLVHNLMKCPLTGASHVLWSDMIRVNKEILNYFPSILITYDELTGFPSGLSAQGKDFFLKHFGF